MNREIKFRIWNHFLEKMSEPKKLNIDAEINQYFLDRLPHHHFELMQYTGLKDKNGVEIYDGDIVEFVGGTCDVLTDYYSRHAIGKVLAVKLLKSGFTLIPTPTDYKSETPNTCGFIGNYQLWNNSRSLNVIGNIYENQELLKK